MMHVHPTPAEAAEHCAKYLAQIIEDAIHERGRADVALSGGSTPKLMFQYLVREKVDWSKVRLYQVDERGVPPGHPVSNSTMIEEHLLQPAEIDAENFHRIQGELHATDAAMRYAEVLRHDFGPDPVFDAILCGVGPDAHTASLFPGDPLVLDRTGLVSATWVEKMSQWRITVLPRILLLARQILVLAAGTDKATAIRMVFDDATPDLDAPAKILLHGSGLTHWFLDHDAGPHE